MEISSANFIQNLDVDAFKSKLKPRKWLVAEYSEYSATLALLDEDIRDKWGLEKEKFINGKIYFSTSEDRNEGFLLRKANPETAYRVLLHWGSNAEEYYLGDAGFSVAPTDGVLFEQESCIQGDLALSKNPKIKMVRDGKVVTTLRPRNYRRKTLVMDYLFAPETIEFFKKINVPIEHGQRFSKTMEGMSDLIKPKTTTSTTNSTTTTTDEDRIEEITTE